MAAERKHREMAWFKREKKAIAEATPPEERRVRTEGLWTKCENCRTITFRKDLEENLFVCPKCQFHFKMGAKARIDMLLDLADVVLKGRCGLRFELGSGGWKGQHRGRDNPSHTTSIFPLV